jgi:flagellar export protein FliJ
MEDNKRVWPLLGKLSEADEFRAFSALRAALEKHADCLRHQQRLLAMREDYEKRITPAQGLILDGRDIAICHNFIRHIDGLQKLMQQQIEALARAIGEAQCAYEKARLNTAKWAHLEEREAAMQHLRRMSSEQKRIDESAAVRFAQRVGR